MQDKSKIRLEIDYIEHQRDYFGAEVGDKLKELNDKLNNNMRYLITCDVMQPFLTHWFDAENNFNADVNMVVYDLFSFKYTNNGVDWFEIQEDNL